MKKKKGTKIFTALFVLCLVLLVALYTVGGYYDPLLTVALQKSAMEKDLVETYYEAGKDVNERIEEEGIVLLENKEQTLPIAPQKVNVFGYGAVNLAYNGAGSAAGSSKEVIDLKTALEEQGFFVNEDLWELLQKNSKEADKSVHEGNGVSAKEFPIPELEQTAYTGKCAMDQLKAYSDTAFVVFTRNGGEGKDLPRTGYGEDESGHYLQLSKEEKDLLITLKEQRFKTIVLINSSYAMELGELKQEAYGVDAAVWIGGPGVCGCSAVAKVLDGSVTPSGRLVDTYAYQMDTASTYIDSDYYYYRDANDSEKQIGGFTNYSEGIYMGYRWYETADAQGVWNEVENAYGSGYDGVVEYPFGYGLSYTTFQQELTDVKEKDGVLNFTVDVTNTGDTYEGKEVVQIYAEQPYENGGIEKSKVQLAAFGKTSLLAPGEKETVTLSVTMEDLASYDRMAEKELGAYVLEAGNYKFYVSEDAHSWAKEDVISYEYQVPETIVYQGKESRSSDRVTASNQLKGSEGEIEVLSRKDGFANAKDSIWAKVEDVDLKEKDALYQSLVTDAEKAGDFQGTVTDTTTGADGRKKLSELKGAAFDDPQWEELISEMSADEMELLIGTGGWSTAEIKRIQKNKTTDIDGPFGLSNFIKNELGNSESLCVSYGSEVVLASTWNKELAEEYGEAIGNEANATGVSGWYAPGANLHRTPFGGRNSEYFSEDSYLSGEFALNVVKGANEKGLYTYMKHFAFNEIEANRINKECVWLDEQTARELYLRPFEMAVKSKYATGMMASYMWVNGQWCGGNYELITKILREEWGFQGTVVTDNYCSGWMNATKALMAGTDLILTNSSKQLDPDVKTSKEGITAMKNACHHILYMIADSTTRREIEAKEGTNYWRLIKIAGYVIFSLGAVLSAFGIFLRKQIRATDRNQGGTGKVNR